MLILVISKVTGSLGFVGEGVYHHILVAFFGNLYFHFSNLFCGHLPDFARTTFVCPEKSDKKIAKQVVEFICD